MTPLDLDAIERSVAAATPHAEPGTVLEEALEHVRPLCARVRELERLLRECDEETRLR